MALVTPGNGNANVPEPIARRVGWLVFTVASGLRLAAGLLTGRLLHPETFEYDRMARSLLAGNGLTYRHLRVFYHSFAPPLYGWLSAGSYWISGSLVPLTILQIIVGGWLAVLTAAIARRLYPGWFAPLVAGMLVAF